MPIARDFSLDAKYRQEEGVVFLSGIQALVRLPLDQHRADRRRGLNTATLISGYRGSPLGGLDLTLERNRPTAAPSTTSSSSPASTRTSAPPSSTAASSPTCFPQPKYDGVLGMWYGKGAGRRPHAATSSSTPTSPASASNGGVLALGGDDPLSKSSTLPTALRGRVLRRAVPGALPGQRAGDPRHRAAWASSSRATPGSGSASRSSPTSPTRSAPPRSRPAA